MGAGALSTTQGTALNAGSATAAGKLRTAGPKSHARRRGRLVVRALIVADLVGLGLAFAASETFFGGTGDPAAPELLAFACSLPLWIVGAKIYELYDHDEENLDHTTIEDFWRVFQLVTIGSWLLFLAAWATSLADPTVRKLASFWVLAILFVAGARTAARIVVRRSPAYRQNALIVGAGKVGQLVARKLLQHPEYAIDIVGFVDARPLTMRPDLGGLRVLGGPDDLAAVVDRNDVDRVIVAFSNEPYERTLEIVAQLQRRNLQIDIVPRLYEAVGRNVDMHTVESLPLVSLPAKKLFPLSLPIKRIVDVVGATVGLLLTSPLFAYAAWRIRRESPGPVFFRQTRLGKDQCEFTTLKFRTMRTDADENVHREYIRQITKESAAPTSNGLYKLERADVVTPFGAWLRKTSLDELPQLINVLRGEMSLVGPRPCLPYELEHFEPLHFERFSVPAGITGLWQVTARAHATFGEALDIDVAYARNWSLQLDLWLLLRTPLHMLRRKGTA